MSTYAVESIFASILSDRGSASRFDQTQLQVARRVAQMLADDGDLSATALSALLGLLPAKPSDTEPAWNLALLTDRELEQLDTLAAKATGTAPPSVEPKRKGPPRRSPRQREAEELALLLDMLEAEGDAARKKDWRRPYALTDDDAMHVRNSIVTMLGLVVLPRRLFVEIESAEAARKESAVPAAVLDTPSAPVPPVVEQPKPEQPPSNVTQFAGLFTAPRRYPGESRAEARTDDLPRGRW
jgi:hypothetical protein